MRKRFHNLTKRTKAKLKTVKHKRKGKLSVEGLGNDNDEEHKEYIKAQIDKTLTKIDKDASFRYGKMIEEFLKISPKNKGKVLCVGCRNAYELDAFEKVGFEKVQGIDLVSVDPRITVMDMDDMKFENDTFDLIYSGDSLEHSYDIEKAAHQFCRVVRSGGHIAIDTPVNFPTGKVDRWDLKSVNGLMSLFRPHAKEILLLWKEVSPQHIRVILKVIK